MQDPQGSERYRNLNEVGSVYRSRHRRSPVAILGNSAKCMYLSFLPHSQVIFDFATVLTSHMSQVASTSTASSSFQTIFDAALKSYERKTKKNLLSHPLAAQLQSCNSSSAIRTLLQDQVREFDQAHSGDERLTKWLSPTVNVLCAFSAAISGGVSLVSRQQS